MADFPNKPHIAIIGLGYVGLPLAVEFGKRYETVGFDINQKRLQELSEGTDTTLETSREELLASTQLSFTADIDSLSQCNVFIVTVPTPIDKNNRPDLSPLTKATTAIAPLLKKGDTVIYESTVYPGTTEEDCVPLLEQGSKLSFNLDFFVGYSPERINPGDKQRRLTNILKITSGSNSDTADYVDNLYQSIITAGTYKAESIRVAEAAKVIENTQRDVNIALVNELALIFNKLDIDTEAVLKAAGTKWNFLPFRPGLVGGHCISVDPYYLAHKAQSAGYHPDLIMTARRLNDGIGEYVAMQLLKTMMKANINVSHSRVLIMGFAFKENCPDLRNTKVIDIIEELSSYNLDIDIYDPYVCKQEVKQQYGLDIIDQPAPDSYDGIILCVAHSQFVAMGEQQIRALGKNEHILYDVKYLLPAESSDLRL